jgi:predicted RNA-binding Zn-ribbon protein involved in translation (DUF1610 family)
MKLMAQLNYQHPFDTDSPFLASDEYNRGYKTWGDYLQDEAENGFVFDCPACGASLFIWLDCRRGELDRSCAHCGYSHKPVIQQVLRQAAEQMNF